MFRWASLLAGERISLVVGPLWSSTKHLCQSSQIWTASSCFCELPETSNIINLFSAENLGRNIGLVRGLFVRAHRKVEGMLVMGTAEVLLLSRFVVLLHKLIFHTFINLASVVVVPGKTCFQFPHTFHFFFYKSFNSGRGGEMAAGWDQQLGQWLWSQVLLQIPMIFCPFPF